MTYKGSEVNKQTLDPTLQQEITNATNKANNSWQKGAFNDTNITNLSAYSASKTLYFNDWDADNSKLDSMYINIPVGNGFSGLVKLTLTSDYNFGNAMGGAEIVYNVAKIGEEVFLNTMIINSISQHFATCFYVKPLVSAASRLYIPITKAPTTRNAINIKVEIFSSLAIFDVVNNITLERDSLISQPHPWTPQTPTALMPNTYNATNTITNVGVNRATRVFPQVNWKGAQSTPELWESILIMNKPVWGILELDIAGYSAASGGAKIIVELGISVPNDTTSPSVEFRNIMKVVTASAGFTDNFYVRVEHRPSSRYLIIQVFKRIYNDPVSVVATFTSTASPQAAFETLKGFSDGVNYTSGITIPTTLQKDFDTRITENFTLFSSFKQKIASATTDKGVPTNADATSDQMAANIRAIQSGGYISNTIQSSPAPVTFTYLNGTTQLMNHVDIIGLPFTPKAIIVQANTGGGNMSMTLYTSVTDAYGYANTSKIFLENQGYYSSSPNHNFQTLSYGGGLRIPVTSANYTYTYHAFG